MHLLRYELLVTCSPTVCLEVEEYICHPYYFVLSIWIFRIIYLELFCLEERSIFVQFLDLHPHYFAFIYSQTLKNARLRSCAVRSKEQSHRSWVVTKMFPRPFRQRATRNNVTVFNLERRAPLCFYFLPQNSSRVHLHFWIDRNPGDDNGIQSESRRASGRGRRRRASPTRRRALLDGGERTRA